MQPVQPLRIGLTLALTAGLLSLACAMLVALSPEGMVNIFQSWWHGLDVTRLAVDAPPMTWTGVASGLFSLMVFAFLAGSLFGYVYNLVGRRRGAMPRA